MGLGEWLGLRQAGAHRWTMEVTPAVVAGSSSLYGGCATAAALVAAGTLTEHPPRWACTHFTGLARLGASIELTAEVLGAGRTVAHVAVEATNGDGQRCFTTRVTLGSRPPVAEAHPPLPNVPPPESCPPFHHRSHDGTFAERFEWRLVPVADRPAAAWWLRSTEGPLPAAVAGAVACDYLTYGIGRASGHHVGGLSVDNVVRLHSEGDVEGWLLLWVEADALDGGFGSGTARVWQADGIALCTGSQTMVLNPWDWRQPGE